MFKDKVYNSLLIGKKILEKNVAIVIAAVAIAAGIYSIYDIRRDLRESRGVSTTISSTTISSRGDYITPNFTNKNYLEQRLELEDFNKAGWTEFYNANERERIQSYYMNEDIPRNPSNWYLYIRKVREKNNNNLEGLILLPDLDGDGKVGK